MPVVEIEPTHADWILGGEVGQHTGGAGRRAEPWLGHAGG